MMSGALLTPPERAELVTALRGAGCVFAEDEARLLEQEASSRAQLDSWATRRSAGEPLEVLVGWAVFRGLRVGVAPGVFIPRRRTEQLVDAALELLPARGVAADLCTGSGAVALALSHERPEVELLAADLDPAAVRCAAANLGGRATVLLSDLFAALPHRLRGRLDLVSANVPYVPSGDLGLLPVDARHHEPVLAHDGGADGLGVLRRLSSQAAQWLRRGGHLVVEVAAHQEAAARHTLDADGLVPSRLRMRDGTVVLGGGLP